MGIDLYWMPLSPPARAVLMVAKELGLDVNFKLIDLMKKEQFTPEHSDTVRHLFEINPQRCVPTIVDNDQGGFNLWESRAIMTYLVNQYAPGHDLYPDSPKGRAIVDRFLYFDIGSLYPAVSAVVYPVLLYKQPLDETKVPTLKEKLGLLDKQLEGKKFLVGSNITLADISIYSSLTMLQFVEIDFSEFKNIAEWQKLFASTFKSCGEVNDEPIAQMKAYLKSQV